MKLKFSGHERFPRPTKLSAEELAKKGEDKNGWFDWDGESHTEDDVFIVRFTTNVFILDKLTEKQQEEVLAHEKRHWEIFQRHALELKAALERIIKQKGDPEAEMDARWKWMKYDYCRASAAFHHEVGRVALTICSEPSTPRPK